MKALIIGASGATGTNLLDLLLADSAYTEVVTFVRRNSGKSHPKLTEILTDFDQLEEVSTDIKGDVWFSCLGTTLKAAGSKDKQWHIDYEIPLQFAKIAKRNGVPSAVLLSAYGASPSSNLFYSKLKGKLEEAIGTLMFDRYIIFKPGVLLRENSDRMGEHLTIGAIKILNKLGLFKKFSAMPTATLASKMVKATKVLKSGTHIIELEKIFSF
ncbi:NAD-dependent epimerase/dehydratase family protein [Pedobacter chinensis]|uniref:NAD-dependent epimerase/dehydratase family protein n=1 Tax=Pedobacter chinensis TaxID=2282421 RepID=A0A369PVG9_9SPHI|nr:NAD(P)H-binding protein [Pedobacter chinensis]RDC56504.1 NAD-dependent epimerase/dehydratase family protein [Pedobacter chinensis]